LLPQTWLYILCISLSISVSLCASSPCFCSTVLVMVWFCKWHQAESHVSRVSLFTIPLLYCFIILFFSLSSS
jgi:hypothetical protein